MDVETTTKNKGNPHTQSNQLVTVQVKLDNEQPKVFFKPDWNQAIYDCSQATCIVGFNLKFDLSWLDRVFGFKATCIWDCQLAEFILSGQKWKYPSLEETAVKYGVGHKQDLVKQYWNNGIDTPDIPPEILAEYGAQDVEITYQIFLKQLEIFAEKPQMFKLFRLHCNDLLCLQEMEMNGILYDVNKSLAKSQELTTQINNIEAQLNEFTNGIPINFDSRDDMSVFLYGGSIKTETRIPCGVYKSGNKVGEVRYKIIKNEYPFERRVEPPKGSELKKEGYFSTDEATLLTVKTNKISKFIITKILERSKLCKLRSTYLEGLPKVIKEMEWPDNTLFSNLNQCVATTGRLSSTKPNQQNLPGEAKMFCVSRY